MFKIVAKLSSTMRALVFDKTLGLKEVPRPERKSGESLVRVTMAGICNTDLEILKGYMGFTGIIGHEFVGRVEESDQSDLIGKRVVGEINIGCGKCSWCQRGLERHCPNRSVLGILNHPGAFAEYLILPDLNLLPVPSGVSDEQAVFTEPLAAALEIREQVHIKPDASVCIIGDGKLGLLIAWTLSLAALNLTVIGRHSERASFLTSKKIRWVSSDRDMDDKFDIVIETSGSPVGWDTAVRMTRPRGTLVLKSTHAGGRELNLSPLVVNEITVVGSRCGRFAPALALLQKGLVDPIPLIATRYDLIDYIEAFAQARDHSLKVLLIFPPEK